MKNMINLNKKLCMLALIISVLLVITCYSLFNFTLISKGERCGNGICGYGENEENCCIDCGCNNKICNTKSNKCEEFIVNIKDEEFVYKVKKYLTERGFGEIINITFIEPVVYENTPAKSGLIILDNDVLGAILLENNTLILKKEFRVLDVVVMK